MAHELLRLESGAVPARQNVRGGLAGWQRKKLAEYIEEHLAEDISLPALAEIARLETPFHFARAFKQSFGLPRTATWSAAGSRRPRACWRHPTWR